MTDMPTPIPQPDGLNDAKGQTTQTGYRYFQSLDKSARSMAQQIAALPATAAQYQANGAGVLLGPNAVWTAAAFEGLTDAATIAIDMSLLFNMSVSIAGNRTLGNPSNTKVGQSGCIAVTASGGTRTLQKGSNWKSNDITWPISIASGTTTYVFYFVFSSTVILVTGLMANPT